jgi:hypothetical protein
LCSDAALLDRAGARQRLDSLERNRKH